VTTPSCAGATAVAADRDSPRSVPRSAESDLPATAIEVLDTKDDLSTISDNVGGRFPNILAARRVLRSIGELPSSLVEDERRVIEHNPPVRRRFLDHPHVRR